MDRVYLIFFQTKGRRGCLGRELTGRALVLTNHGSRSLPRPGHLTRNAQVVWIPEELFFVVVWGGARDLVSPEEGGRFLANPDQP